LNTSLRARLPRYENGENGDVHHFDHYPKSLVPVHSKDIGEKMPPVIDYDAYRLLVQAVKDYAIFMLDPKGNILTWNAGAQRLKGYKPDEIIGKHFSIFYGKEDKANRKPQRELETATMEGRVEDEGWRLRKDGTRFWANVVITALHDEKGKLRGFAKVTRDMTERRKAEEILREQAALLEMRVHERTGELERANRMKDEFITTLSHELRTPITAITGWIQMMQQGALTPDQERRALDVIGRNLAAQTQLIDDLLNVSRIVAGKLRIDMQPVYPGALVEDAIDSIIPTAKAKSLKLTRDLDMKLGPVQIDPERFHQIVWNLLANALKFTGRHGHIHVCLKRIDSSALLQITDSGEGIDPEFLPYVFDRFRQADASRSRKHGGLGVGLTIVKYLVELHGGIASAESAGLGKGSTFSIGLPIPALASNVRAGAGAKPHEGTGLTGTRILLVEDEADMREMLAHALTRHGAKTLQANSAKQALRLLEKGKLDLIISDIGMPEVDGYTFMRKVRSMRSTNSTVRSIALTAYAGEEDRKLAAEAGYNSHIPKPITLAELIGVINKLIGERRKLSA
jgi:PAS domain S-box-containing protein